MSSCQYEHPYFSLFVRGLIIVRCSKVRCAAHIDIRCGSTLVRDAHHAQTHLTSFGARLSTVVCVSSSAGSRVTSVEWIRSSIISCQGRFQLSVLVCRVEYRYRHVCSARLSISPRLGLPQCPLRAVRHRPHPGSEVFGPAKAAIVLISRYFERVSDMLMSPRCVKSTSAGD